MSSRYWVGTRPGGEGRTTFCLYSARVIYHACDIQERRYLGAMSPSGFICSLCVCVKVCV